MTANVPPICVCMIVKDEAAVIERCLESVKPLVSRWLIVDTGSTDDTPAIIERTMRGIPGQLHRRPWKDFAFNRSEALALGREGVRPGEYFLVIDADDSLVVPADVSIPPLTAGAYSLRIEYAGTTYYRVQLLRADLPWRYVGVVHEAPECDVPYERGVVEGIVYRIGSGGARARNPDRYLHDARLLEAALAEDPTNTRYVFYLGQSYRDAGMPGEALVAYERRASMGGWEEEVFYSLLQAAWLRESLGQPRETVWSAYLKAHRARPERAEALTELARYCRGANEFSLGYVFAEAATKIPRPKDVLFVNEATYEWRALDELAVAAFYMGKFDVCAAACAKLLSEQRAPESDIARIKKNLELCGTSKAPRS